MAGPSLWPVCDRATIARPQVFESFPAEADLRSMHVRVTDIHRPTHNGADARSKKGYVGEVLFVMGFVSISLVENRFS